MISCNLGAIQLPQRTEVSACAALLFKVNVYFEKVGSVQVVAWASEF